MVNAEAAVELLTDAIHGRCRKIYHDFNPFHNAALTAPINRKSVSE